MKQKWLDFELKEAFTLTDEEQILSRGKSKNYQVLFLTVYKACKKQRTIPKEVPRFSSNVTQFIADQLGVDHPTIETIPSRSQRHILQEIRGKLRFGKLNPRDKEDLKRFLIKEVLPNNHHPEFIKDRLRKHLKKNHLALLSREEEKEILQSAHYLFEKEFFSRFSKNFLMSLKGQLTHGLTFIDPLI